MADILYANDDPDEDANEDDDEGGGENGGGDGDKWQKRQQCIFMFLVDGSKLMLKECEIKRNDLQDDYLGQKKLSNHYALALSIISQFCRDKVRRSHSDQIGVAVYNADPSNNKWEMPGVRVLMNLQTPDVVDIKTLEQEASRGTYSTGTNSAGPKANVWEGNACTLDNALMLAKNAFDDCGLKDARKFVCLLTCNDDPIGGQSKDKDRARRKAALLKRLEDLKSGGVCVDVYPLIDNVSLEGIRDEALPSLDVFRGGVCFKEILELFEEAADKKEAAEQVDEKLTQRKVIHLLNEMEGAASTRSTASIKWFVVKGKVEVAVKVYSLVMELKPKLPVKVYKQDNRRVKDLVEIMCQDSGQLLMSSEIGRVYWYGNQAIPVSAEEMTSYKSLGVDKGLHLVGFKPASSLLPYMNVSAPYFIYPDEKASQGSTCAFRAFWTQMHEDEVAAICFGRLRATAVPRFYALVAQKENRTAYTVEVPDGLHLVPLPFCDDVRSLPTQAACEEPSKEAVRAAINVVKFLNMEDWGPADIPNPSLFRHFAHLEAIALQECVDEGMLRDVDAKMQFDTTFAQYNQLEGKMKHLKDAVHADYDQEVQAGASAAGAKRKREAAPRMKLDPNGTWGGIQQDDFPKMKVDALKDYLRGHGLPVSGKKDDLVERCTSHFLDV